MWFVDLTFFSSGERESSSDDIDLLLQAGPVLSIWLFLLNFSIFWPCIQTFITELARTRLHLRHARPNLEVSVIEDILFYKSFSMYLVSPALSICTCSC